MNKSYSKIRHIQESNRILETRLIVENNKYDLLNEQSDVWVNVKPNGTDPNSPKNITTKIPASNFLFNGKQVYVTSQNQRLSLLIGATIDANYREKLQLKNLTDNESARSGRFGCVIDINVTIPGAQGAFTALQIFITQRKSGKFQTYLKGDFWTSNETWKKAYPIGLYVLDDSKKVEMPSQLNNNVIGKNLSSNLSGYLGETFTKINTELDRLGFPQIPSDISKPIMS
jgi:hypothetical protein